MIGKSKFLSLILRHSPEKANISLDKNGWAKVDEILSSVSLSKEQLDQIVDSNNKKRFEYNNDKSMIRARQGHSIQVDVELKKEVPPRILYHGTKSSNVNLIKSNGLIKMNRLHVHLSSDELTARKVAERRDGKNLILSIQALDMYNDGYEFFLSNNDVWLTDHVPPKYIF